MKKIFISLVFLIIVHIVSQQSFAAITYSLDNSCGTSQLVVLITPDINYSGSTAIWSPAAFTISWPMTLPSTILGAISNQNGFSFGTAGGVGNDGTNYYQSYSHTGIATLALNAGTSYEITRITLNGSLGAFGTLQIPPSSNSWVIANNGQSTMLNSNGNQVSTTYGSYNLANIPLFAGIFWDGTSWCGGSGANQQPGIADGTLNCYISGLGAQLTTWNANVGQLQIDAASQLSILSGASLTAAGTITINSAEGLIIAADATGTGSFINTISPIVYGAGGSAKVQAYMKNVATAGTFHTHLIGPLVKDPTYSGGGTGVYIGAFDLQANNTYAYRYNEPTNAWINMFLITDPIPTAAGLALSDVSATSKVLSMTGQLATPIVTNPTVAPWNPTKTAGQGDGEYLFSNPFPSGLYMDQFYTTNNGAARFSSNNIFYFWEDETSNYGTWSADDPEIGGIGTGNIGAANGLINPGQGFFGQRNGTTNINFTALARIHVHTPFLKDSEISLLRLQASGNLSKDELIIRFKEGATFEFDEKKDAYKWASMYDYATEINTVTPNQSFLTINTLPNLTAGEMTNVPMDFKCGADGTYTITASNIESFESGTEIWLEDLKVGGEWYSLNNNPVYEFTGSPSDEISRFIIHFFGTTGIDDNPQAEVKAIQIYSWGHDAYIVNRGRETVKEYIAYDLMGREIQRGTLPNSTVNKITIGDVSAYYIVKVITKEGRIYTDKVYINK